MILLTFLRSRQGGGVSLGTWVLALAPLVICALTMAAPKGPRVDVMRMVLRTKAEPIRKLTVDVERGRPSNHPDGGTFIVEHDNGNRVEYPEQTAREGFEVLQGVWPE